MFTILAFGGFSLYKMKTSFFPEVVSKTILINFTYRGTSPEEIEESIILKAEQLLKGIEGVEYVTSVSSENTGQVVVNVLDNYDTQEVLVDVKTAIDRITPYPTDAETPVVTIQESRTGVLILAISGNDSLWNIKQKTKPLENTLLAKEGISQISLSGFPSREIAITVDEVQLRKHNLTFEDMSRAVLRSNKDISGGVLKTDKEEILIRSYNKKDIAEQIKNIIIKSSTQGRIIKLSEIASVHEQWADSPKRNYVNGEPAVFMRIDKTVDEDILYVASTVKRELETFKKKHPDLNVIITRDFTTSLIDRIELLKKNGLIGFTLVVCVLGFFLSWRVSFWVALGIPISFCGMFVIAEMVGVTINVISLFGMIIVIGMLVDDAIIVAESIYQRHERGQSPYQAALEGTLDVIGPVFTAVCTTMLAFSPFFFFAGSIGSIVWQVALVVIGALLFSLVESLLILPAHLAHSKGLAQNKKTSTFRKLTESFYQFVTLKIYGPILKLAIEYKLTVVAIVIAMFMIMRGLITGGLVEFSPFPHIPSDRLSLNITMTAGTSETVTQNILKEIEEKAWTLNEQLKKERTDGKDVILYIQRIIGSNQLRDSGSHAGKLDIELINGEMRNIQGYTIGNRLQKMIGTIPGVEKMSFGGGRWGKAITISLLGNNLKELKKATSLLKEALKDYPELKDVVDTEVQGRREIKLKLKDKAYALGLDQNLIATQIRNGFFGIEAQRLQRGDDEIQIWLRYDEQNRSSIDKLETMQIKTPTGGKYFITDLVDYYIERGIVNILHLDGKREVRVEADMVNPTASVTTVMEEIKSKTVPEVLGQVKEVQVSYEGRERNNRKFFKSFINSFPIALVSIFVILILVFRSYLQSILIFLIIPFGIVGAVYGHYLHGLLLSRLSMFGIIALTGIIINDSIVYIDQINRNLREKMSLKDAIFQAGLSRFRPIMLTTVTTVAGLGPIILETSRQAQFLIPMAVSIAYGLLVGSFIILFLVPSLFLLLNDFRFITNRVIRNKDSRESLEPAVKETLESH